MTASKKTEVTAQDFLEKYKNLVKETGFKIVASPAYKVNDKGTINGAGNYGFMLTAIDGAINGGGADKFRIKIWDMDNGDAVVYDNLVGGADDADPTTLLGGGSIVIHKN
jgi:hypothetical protein